jgi:hypothetical protein
MSNPTVKELREAQAVIQEALELLELIPADVVFLDGTITDLKETIAEIDVEIYDLQFEQP